MGLFNFGANYKRGRVFNDRDKMLSLKDLLSSMVLANKGVLFADEDLRTKFHHLALKYNKFKKRYLKNSLKYGVGLDYSAEDIQKFDDSILNYKNPEEQNTNTNTNSKEGLSNYAQSVFNSMAESSTPNLGANLKPDFSKFATTDSMLKASNTNTNTLNGMTNYSNQTFDGPQKNWNLYKIDQALLDNLNKFDFKNNPPSENTENIENTTKPATLDYSDMSFGKAFAAARKAGGPNGTFTWKGKTYGTKYASETKPSLVDSPSSETLGNSNENSNTTQQQSTTPMSSLYGQAARLQNPKYTVLDINYKAWKNSGTNLGRERFNNDLGEGKGLGIKPTNTNLDSLLKDFDSYLIRQDALGTDFSNLPREELLANYLELATGIKHNNVRNGINEFTNLYKLALERDSGIRREEDRGSLTSATGKINNTNTYLKYPNGRPRYVSGKGYWDGKKYIPLNKDEYNQAVQTLDLNLKDDLNVAMYGIKGLSNEDYISAPAT